MMKTLLIFASVIAVASAHGWLKYPVARTAIQKFEADFNTSPPYFFNYIGLWCGNQNQDLSYSNCGRCGEVFGNRDASQGGIYDKGIIVANWTRGSIVEIAAEIVVPHNGQFTIELCPQEQETDNCFQKLNILDGTEPVRIDSSICVTRPGSHEIKARVQLPPGVTCNRCTIRWTYRTNYPEQSPYPGWTACDVRDILHQTFRNCADVSIN